MQITGSGSARIRPQNNRVIVIRNNSPSLFSRELAKKEETILDLERIELEELRDDLKYAGESFETEPNLDNFRIFREMIGRFARKAISLAYRIDRMKGGRSGSIMEFVSIIDRNADEMYRLVLEGERGRVSLAGRIADINGMIFRITV